MRITIVQDDGVAGVDGVFRRIDVSELAGEIRAVQFDTERGAGHIEFDPGVTVEVDVRDFEAEKRAERAAGDDREKQAQLKMITKKGRVRRAPEPISDFAPYQVYLDRWHAAAPPPPSAEQLLTRELEIKRAAALKALDDARLAQAAIDPLAPQEVRDYAVARAKVR